MKSINEIVKVLERFWETQVSLVSDELQLEFFSGDRNTIISPRLHITTQNTANQIIMASRISFWNNFTIVFTLNEFETFKDVLEELEFKDYTISNEDILIFTGPVVQLHLSKEEQLEYSLIYFS